MASLNLTIVSTFYYNIDRLYGLEDIYAALKQKLVGYVDPNTDELVPVVTRYPEDEVIKELEMPSFAIDHLTYQIDTNRTESRVRDVFFDFITRHAFIREGSIPVKINAQIGFYDRYRRNCTNVNQWLIQQFERATSLNVFGNTVTVFFEEPIVMDATLDSAQRQFQCILPCVINAHVFPAVIESAPLIYQRVYRFSVL